MYLKIHIVFSTLLLFQNCTAEVLSKIDKLGTLFNVKELSENCLVILYGSYMEVDFPVIRVDSESDLENYENIYFSKCFVFAAIGDYQEESLKMIDKLTEYLKSYPLFILVEKENLNDSFSDLLYPVITADSKIVIFLSMFLNFDKKFI